MSGPNNQETIIDRLATILFFGSCFAVAIFTQFYHKYSVPGLYFDESWQGLFAHRIATEPGFWPTQAMNAYTSPIVHYGLAAVFHYFGVGLESMRAAIGWLNLTSLAIFTYIVRQYFNKRSALWFMIFWSMLPMNVHAHRYYNEMTYFFLFCFALTCLGAHQLAHCKNRYRPMFSFLITFATLAGIYSHILFIIVPISFSLLSLRYHWIREKPFRLTLAVIYIFTLPLLFRMYEDLKKTSILLLILALVSAIYFHLNRKFESLNYSRLFPKVSLTLLTITLPFFTGYILLFWNGFWPYAQVTGDVRSFFPPINIFYLAIPLYLRWRDRRISDESKFILYAALFTYFLSTVFIFKQSPRYLTIPTLLLSLWCSIEIARTQDLLRHIIVLIIFLSLNGWAFFHRYIFPFDEIGSTRLEYRIGPYTDSSRDYRPFQKVGHWLYEKGCLHTIRGVEDDRFLSNLRFMQVSLPPKKDAICPWKRNELIFSSVPQRTADYPKTDELIYTQADWGDLGIWKLKPEFVGKVPLE